MPWQCRLIQLAAKPKTETHGRGKGRYTISWYVDEATGERPRVGDMFYYPRALKEYREQLTAEYFAKHAAHRPPLCVILPSGTWFVVDYKCTNSETGWDVAGEAPNITVSPSINVVGTYHGFLQNGVLTDDVEGRKFAPEPPPAPRRRPRAKPSDPRRGRSRRK